MPATRSTASRLSAFRFLLTQRLAHLQSCSPLVPKGRHICSRGTCPTDHDTAPIRVPKGRHICSRGTCPTDHGNAPSRVPKGRHTQRHNLVFRRQQSLAEGSEVWRLRLRKLLQVFPKAIQDRIQLAVDGLRRVGDQAIALAEIDNRYARHL